LNLNMPAERVQLLSDRGKLAGEILRDNFDWDRHRWTRLRTSLAQLQAAFDSMAIRYHGKGERTEDFASFLARYAGGAGSYPMKDPALADRALHALTDLAELWQQQRLVLSDDAPRPNPTLRIMPRI